MATDASGLGNVYSITVDAVRKLSDAKVIALLNSEPHLDFEDVLTLE